MEKPTQVSYTNQLFDALSHTVSGAVAGAGLGKAFYPLQVKEGALFGAALNTVTAGAQKLASVVGIEENFVSKAVISAATLAGVFFAMTQPSAAPLLGRVGLDFAKDAIMKFCAASFVAELVLGAAKAYITSAPSIQDEVDALPAEEVKEAFEKWTEKTAKKDDKGNDIDPEISTAYQTAFLKRFEKDGLYTDVVKGLKNSKDIVDARSDVIVFIFKAAPEMTLNAAAKKALDTRIDELKLAEKPEDKEAVEKLDPAVVRHAFTHYTVFTDGMKAETKEALDAKIIEAHAKKPEDKDAAGKMSAEQLTFIYANFTAYTKDMDAEIVTALEDAIVAAGLVEVVKPTAEAEITALNRMEVHAHHAAHDKTFGKPANYADVKLIEAMNARYAEHKLAAQPVPTKPITPPAPKTTGEKVLGGVKTAGHVIGAPVTWLSGKLTGVVPGAQKVVNTVATLPYVGPVLQEVVPPALSMAASWYAMTTFENLTGTDVPYTGFSPFVNGTNTTQV